MDIGYIIGLIKAFGGGGGGEEPTQYLKTISKNETSKTITITSKGGVQTIFPYAEENVLDFLSLERLGINTYKVSFDTIPAYDDSVAGGIYGGCTSFIRNGKMYTNLDWKYDNGAHFWIKTKDFEGLSFIAGLDDSDLDFSKVGQLPYHTNRGRNNDGIMVSSHVLFNDFSYEGSGTKENKITLLPYYILTEVHNISELSTKLEIYLANLQIDAELLAADYLMQFMVSDGTTTYVITPKTDGSGYEIVDISILPKLANFKWLNKQFVERNDADLQDRPTGIERWNLTEGCNLEELRFSLAYESNERLSEFIGINGTTKDSTDAELEAIYEEEREKYLTRTRDGQTWITCHSAIFGEKGLESLYTQENYVIDYVPSASANIDIDIDESKGLTITPEGKMAVNKGAYLIFSSDGGIDTLNSIVPDNDEGLQITGNNKLGVKVDNSTIVFDENGNIKAQSSSISIGNFESSDDIRVRGGTTDPNKVSFVLQESVKTEINNKLSLPEEAPTENEIVYIDDLNRQNGLKVGDGLEIEDGTLIATAGSPNILVDITNDAESGTITPSLIPTIIDKYQICLLRQHIGNQIVMAKASIGSEITGIINFTCVHINGIYNYEVNLMTGAWARTTRTFS